MSINFLEEAAVWLAEAEIDRATAENVAEKFPAPACFHAQQAAEKALEAIYLAGGVDFPHIHAISELLDGLAPTYESLNQFRDVASILDDYYVGTRYFSRVVGAIPRKRYTPKNAKDSIAHATAIASECQRIYARLASRPPGKNAGHDSKDAE